MKFEIEVLRPKGKYQRQISHPPAKEMIWHNDCNQIGSSSPEDQISLLNWTFQRLLLLYLMLCFLETDVFPSEAL